MCFSAVLSFFIENCFNCSGAQIIFNCYECLSLENVDYINPQKNFEINFVRGHSSFSLLFCSAQER